MKLDDKHVIRCATKPNSLYELSISDIDEETFRAESDSSTYITNPEKLKIKNLPAWYQSTFDKIKSESGITPNFLIRMELTNIPDEYLLKEDWDEFINQVRAKNYKIPIYFKNELLNMENFESYENIDLVGINDKNKINEIDVKLYINSITKEFYILFDNKYINVKNIKDIQENSNDKILWGNINMFIVSEEYLINQLKEYNKNNKNSMKQGDFYGIYLYLNNKLTNYKPFSGLPLGDSKNNKIYKGKSSTKFRMIFKPCMENCSNEIFDSLIQTREIKALTGFLDRSPWKKITEISMKIFKGENILKNNQKKTKIIKKKETNYGGIYIVYFGYHLWKFGMVTDYKNMSKRLNDHKNNRDKYLKDFSNLINNDNSIRKDNCLTVYEKETSKPKSDEESIANLKLMKVIK